MDWSGVQLLLRSSQPSHSVVPGGQQEHMLYCNTGQAIRQQPVRSVLRAEGKVYEWRQVPHQDVTFLPAGHPYDWEWNYATQSIHLLVTIDHLQRVSEDITEGKTNHGELCPQFRITDPMVSVLLERLRNELTGSGYGIPLALDAIKDLLCVHLLKAYGGSPVPQPPPSRGLSPNEKARLISYIDDRLSESMGLQELASFAGFSRFHFARLFRQSFGMSPHEYQLHRRIERAREMLRFAPDNSVTHVAVSLGFNDESHFRRHFKRTVGVTPSHYRRSVMP